jgi:acyl-CoA thioesterase-1
VSRILCFGDSLTAGTLSTAAVTLRAGVPESYPSQLLLLLMQRYRNQTFAIENAGRPGEWAQDGLLRFGPTLRAVRPEVVVLLDGLNDVSAQGMRGVDGALDAMDRMAFDALASGARVIVASLPPQRWTSKTATTVDLVPQYNQGLQRLAFRRNVMFADVHRAFGGDLSLLGADGIHPTAEGYRRIAQTVFELLQFAFEQPAAPTGAAAPSL